MCLKEARAYVFSCTVLQLSSHQEENTPLKICVSGQLQSCLTHRCAVTPPPSQPGQNRAQQVRLDDLLHILEIAVEIKMNAISCEKSLCVCVCGREGGGEAVKIN